MAPDDERFRPKAFCLYLAVGFLIGATMPIWSDAPWALLPPVILMAGVVSASCASHRFYFSAVFGTLLICVMWGLGFSIGGTISLKLTGENLIGPGYLLALASVIVAVSAPVFVLWAVIFTMLLKPSSAQPNINECSNCGYSLTGLRERRCPECGHQAPGSDLPHDPWWDDK